MAELEIKEAQFEHPSVLELLARHEAHCTQDTACEKAHRLDMSKLQASDIRFWTLWQGERVIGSVALRNFGDDRGEVKSMHVLSELRGGDYAQILLDHLIDEARIMGIHWLGLETGDTPTFARAVAFYEKNGFEPTEPFGIYTKANAGILLARLI